MGLVFKVPFCRSPAVWLLAAPGKGLPASQAPEAQLILKSVMQELIIVRIGVGGDAGESCRRRAKRRTTSQSSKNLYIHV